MQDGSGSGRWRCGQRDLVGVKAARFGELVNMTARWAALLPGAALASLQEAAVRGYPHRIQGTSSCEPVVHALPFRDAVFAS